MILRNVTRLTQWGYGKGAKPISMFVAAVPAGILAERASIFRRTPHRVDGYQRELAGARLGKGKYGVAGYLLKQMGVFPTSILVNIREDGGQIGFDQKLVLNENVTIGDLTIPDHVSWWVIDGQHRIEGLKIAMRDEPDLEDYPVIVTITNESIFYEMLIFYIVNGRAKSVPTDLAYRIFQRMLYDDSAPSWVRRIVMTGSERRKGVAATIADLLNTIDHSPFKGRIRQVGDIARPAFVTQDGTMTRYVAVLLREKTFATLYDEEVADLLADYWTVLQEMYPDAFKNHDNYVLLGTLGLSSMTRLFSTVYACCAKDRQVSKENMRRYLSCLLRPTPYHEDPEYRQPIAQKWWHRFEGPGLIHGTGEGHYQEIARKLARKIELAERDRKPSAGH